MSGGSFKATGQSLGLKPRLTCVAKTVYMHRSMYLAEVNRCKSTGSFFLISFSVFVFVFFNYDYLRCLWGLENLLMTLINIIPNLDHLAQDFGIAKTSIAHKGPNSMSLPVDDGVSVEAEEELKVVPVGQVGHSVGHVWHSVGHVGHSVGQTVTVSLGYAGQLQLVVPVEQSYRKGRNPMGFRSDALSRQSLKTMFERRWTEGSLVRRIRG